MREQARAGPTAFDRAAGQRGLVEPVTTGAGHAGAHIAVHHEPAGDILKLLGDILANALQLAAAVIAGLARLKHLVDPWQVIRQRLAGRLVFRGRLWRASGNLCAAGDLQVFQHQLQLLEAFGR